MGTQAFPMDDPNAAHLTAHCPVDEIEQDPLRSLNSHVVQVDRV